MMVPAYVEGQMLYVYTAYLHSPLGARQMPIQLCKIIEVLRGVVGTGYRVELFTAGALQGEQVIVPEAALTIRRPRGTTLGPVMQPAVHPATRVTPPPLRSERGLEQTPVWDMPTRPTIPSLQVRRPEDDPELERREEAGQRGRRGRRHGDALLLVDEVAERLSLHPDTIRRWIRAGELEAIDLGGPAGYRIAESELSRFIRDRATRRRES